ncbi:hypothetical protein GCM10023186_21530 [Hymenobacter koreensis]|uniref:Gliding motility-associated C-terminal domain-containing protein n=1 Tax=Hymenobacter koreensis TaxID=1084523 RepID=A0ABP8IZC3_9BACT
MAPDSAWATHIQAGDIQAKSDTTAARNPRRVFFKMILYMEAGIPATTANNPETIYFGDGTRLEVTRTSERLFPGFVSILQRTFLFEHTFNAPGTYDVSHAGENRFSSVVNITNPASQTFFISTRITIDPLLGLNRSAVLNAPAVDLAAVGQVFLHNPAASDADGDSLAFRLEFSQQARGPVSVVNSTAPINTPLPRPTDGYVYPNNPRFGGVQVPYSGPPTPTLNAPATYTIDARTGQLVWNSPGREGDYNAAFIVEEWRRNPDGSRKQVGYVLRDMLIRVKGTTNRRPTVFVPQDTCVVAGDLVVGKVSATDLDDNFIRLQAFGGMLPPATFRKIRSSNRPGSARGEFRWRTTCADVGSEPKLVLFKAEDSVSTSGPFVQLIDERAWRITVVGPPPRNVVAQRNGNNVILTWNQYACQLNPNVQLHIYRKEGPSNWSPGACETGIPASTGFVRIATVRGDLQSYLDTRNGQGMERGKTYCYRIYAEFPRPAGGASIASAETCVNFDGRPAALRNVTVDATSATAGQITVRWTRPVPPTGATFNTPSGYALYRATQAAATVFTRVDSTTNLNDTVFVDRNLNTATNRYLYRLVFFNATTPQGSTYSREIATPATSVRLIGTFDTTRTLTQPRIILRWTYNVPWNNSLRPVTIYRQTQGSSTFTVLATAPTDSASGGTYTDTDVVAGRTYCYYVSTDGRLALPRRTNLINLSQQLCVTPVPCTPVLRVQVTNCDSLNANLFNLGKVLPGTTRYTNTLRWQPGNQPNGCNATVAYYRILRQNAEGRFVAIDSVSGSITTYEDRNLETSAQCYRVQAVDAGGQRSGLSNAACNDNCPLFLLPNIFTPNDDRVNDYFTPKVASQVLSAKVQVFNRWGAKVYEGRANPTTLLLWDGGGAKGNEGIDKGARVADGMYYYLVDVEFADLNKTKKTFKGWVEVNR